MPQSGNYYTFLDTYVNTNIPPSAVRYDRQVLLDQLLGNLIMVNKERFDRIGLHVLVSHGVLSIPKLQHLV